MLARSPSKPLVTAKNRGDHAQGVAHVPRARVGVRLPSLGLTAFRPAALFALGFLGALSACDGVILDVQPRGGDRDQGGQNPTGDDTHSGGSQGSDGDSQNGDGANNGPGNGGSTGGSNGGKPNSGNPNDGSHDGQPNDGSDDGSPNDGSHGGNPNDGSKDDGDDGTVSDDPHQRCVDRINALRATVGLGPLERWTEAEDCSDEQSKRDFEGAGAHGSFGQCQESAQNTCPRWPGGVDAIIGGCLDAMWNEGPPPQTPCEGSCFQAHGHYINMTNTRYSRVACGFYIGPDGRVWSNQNFR